MAEKIAIIGLGYVGLPVALAFAKAFPGTIGFDIHKEKVAELQRGYDRNLEISEEELKSNPIKISCDPEDLKGACLLYTSPSPRDRTRSRMPSSA